MDYHFRNVLVNIIFCQSYSKLIHFHPYGFYLSPISNETIYIYIYLKYIIIIKVYYIMLDMLLYNIILHLSIAKCAMLF